MIGRMSTYHFPRQSLTGAFLPGLAFSFSNFDDEQGLFTSVQEARSPVTVMYA